MTVPLHPCLYLLIALLPLLHLVDTILAAATPCHADDETGLLAFKSSFPPFYQLSNWIPGTACCSWSGVGCSDGTGRVTDIYLFNPSPSSSSSDTTTSSSISPSLSLLSHLTTLTIAQFPDLSGPLPDSLFFLPRLQRLFITSSSISGPFPSNISSGSPLQTIILTGNRISGTIPPSISKLTQLIGLDMVSNLLTGEIPSVISQMRSLTSIRLSQNRLSGATPDLSPLSNLQYLYLSDNKLTGSIPRLPLSLTELDLRNNSITGVIPPSITNLTRLRNFYLSGNLLSGEIPSEISRMRQLSSALLDHNQLSGAIPDFSPLSNLIFLSLSDNKLCGAIPPTLAGLAPSLNTLDLSNNLLTGRIPDIFWNFTSLGTLRLSHNHLHGPVPESFKRLTRIYNLELSNNFLANPFPNLTLSSMTKLDLSYNRFRFGTIPEWITSLTFISTLNLAGCGIEMKMEDWKPVVPTFQDPDSYYSSSYAVIDLSNNRMSGSLAELLNRTKFVIEFRAAGNKLEFDMTGMKFPATAFPGGLGILDLSRNSIFGAVTPSITILKEVNLSCNHLCGQLPANNFSASAFIGNDCLCGPPLPPCRR